MHEPPLPDVPVPDEPQAEVQPVDAEPAARALWLPDEQVAHELRSA